MPRKYSVMDTGEVLVRVDIPPDAVDYQYVGDVFEGEGDGHVVHAGGMMFSASQEEFEQLVGRVADDLSEIAQQRRR